MSKVQELANPNQVRDEWIKRLQDLVTDVEKWAKEIGWEVTRIDKKMRDSGVGSYKAPALVFQKEFTRLLLDPISREAPGADGVVDLYRMPALDDVASLYSYKGKWQIHDVQPKKITEAMVDEAEAIPLTRESFEAVVGRIGSHGA